MIDVQLRNSSTRFCPGVIELAEEDSYCGPGEKKSSILAAIDEDPDLIMGSEENSGDKEGENLLDAILQQ